jgi:molybdopterin converting factor small subunit
MAIQLMFFGATAAIVGVRKSSFEFTGEITAFELLERVKAAHPQLARHKLLFSLNQEYVSENAPLSNGDEVAIFTPVSGG